MKNKLALKGRIRYGIECDRNGETWSVLRAIGEPVFVGTLDEVIDWLNTHTWDMLARVNVYEFRKRFETCAQAYNIHPRKLGSMDWISRYYHTNDGVQMKPMGMLTHKQDVYEIALDSSTLDALTKALTYVPKDYMIVTGVPVNSREYFANVLTIKVDNINRKVYLNYDL